jgi:hypothetical protein
MSYYIIATRTINSYSTLGSLKIHWRVIPLPLEEIGKRFQVHPTFLKRTDSFISCKPFSPNNSTPNPAAFKIDSGGWNRSLISSFPRTMPRFFNRPRYGLQQISFDRSQARFELAGHFRNAPVKIIRIHRHLHFAFDES